MRERGNTRHTHEHATLLSTNKRMPPPPIVMSRPLPTPFLPLPPCSPLASIALLRSNWYPASVFVGDTYCYSAGVVFAVVGIHGHFSKTLLLFFIPQIINFLLSIPQLAGVVPCPRHRLPRFNKETELMEPSRHEKGGVNLTLINAWLLGRGPMREERLTFELLMLQIFMSGVGMAVRYGGGRGWIFEEEL